MPRPPTRQALLIKTRREPLALAPDVRTAIWSVDPALPIGEISTLDAAVRASLAPQRYRALLMSLFAAVAMALTAVGIAGVTVRAVSARLRELCIRMAVGATAGDVIRLIVARYFRIGLLGLTIGSAAALAAMRLVETYLSGVTTRDPLTYVVVGLLLLAVVSIAGWLPARRLRHAQIAELLTGDK